MMTNYHFDALSMKNPKDKKLLLDFLYEITFDIKQAGNKSTKDKSW